MFGRRKPKISREQSLTIRPVRNENVEWSEVGDNEILIIVKPRKDRVAKMFRWMFPPPPEKQITLDEVGSEVWRMCDGSHTVNQVIRKLMARYKLNRKEAETSTTAYLKQLGKRSLLGFL